MSSSTRNLGARPNAGKVTSVGSSSSQPKSSGFMTQLYSNVAAKTGTPGMVLPAASGASGTTGSAGSSSGLPGGVGSTSGGGATGSYTTTTGGSYTTATTVGNNSYTSPTVGSSPSTMPVVGSGSGLTQLYGNSSAKASGMVGTTGTSTTSSIGTAAKRDSAIIADLVSNTAQQKSNGPGSPLYATTGGSPYAATGMPGIGGANIMPGMPGSPINANNPYTTVGATTGGNPYGTGSAGENPYATTGAGTTGPGSPYGARPYSPNTVPIRPTSPYSNVQLQSSTTPGIGGQTPGMQQPGMQMGQPGMQSQQMPGGSTYPYQMGQQPVGQIMQPGMMQQQGVLPGMQMQGQIQPGMQQQPQLTAAQREAQLQSAKAKNDPAVQWLEKVEGYKKIEKDKEDQKTQQKELQKQKDQELDKAMSPMKGSMKGRVRSNTSEDKMCQNRSLSPGGMSDISPVSFGKDRGGFSPGRDGGGGGGDDVPNGGDGGNNMSAFARSAAAAALITEPQPATNSIEIPAIPHLSLKHVVQGSLHYHAGKGNVNYVEYLLKDAEKKCDRFFIHCGEAFNGHSPLHYAVCNNQKEITQILLDFGSDLLQRNRQQRIPLHIGTYKGNFELCHLMLGTLLKRLRVESYNKFRKLKLIGQGGSSSMMYEDQSGFERRIAFQCLKEYLRNLEDLRLNLLGLEDVYGCTVLHYAIRDSYQGCLMCLLLFLDSLWAPNPIDIKKKTQKINQKHCADLIGGGKWDIGGGGVKNDGVVAYFCSLLLPHERTHLMKEHTARSRYIHDRIVNGYDSSGYTLLHHASAMGNYRGVHVLMTRKADSRLTTLWGTTNGPNYDGYTPGGGRNSLKNAVNNGTVSNTKNTKNTSTRLQNESQNVGFTAFELARDAITKKALGQYFSSTVAADNRRDDDVNGIKKSSLIGGGGSRTPADRTPRGGVPGFGNELTPRSQIGGAGFDPSSEMDILTKKATHVAEQFGDQVNDPRGLLGRSACHISVFSAIQRDSDASLQALLEVHNETDVWKPDTNGWSPIHYAANYGKYDELQLLLRHSRKMGRLPPTLGGGGKLKVGMSDKAFRGSFGGGKKGLVFGQKSMKNINISDRNACSSDMMSVCTAQPLTGRTPTHVAAMGGSTEVLLDDPHLKCLQVLKIEGWLELEKRDHKGNTPLLLAANSGATAVCHFLLQSKANMVASDTSGRTCLHLAIQHNRVSTVRLLTYFDSDLCRLKNKKDCRGKIPAQMLAVNKVVVDPKTMPGGDENAAAKNAFLKTPESTSTNHQALQPADLVSIWEACRKGDIDHVRGWLRTNPDVDILSPSGWTPLMYSSACGHVVLTRFLLAAKANVNSSSAIVSSASSMIDAMGIHGSSNGKLGISGGNMMNAADITTLKAFADLRPRKGRLPIHLAAFYGHAGIVSLLHDLGGQSYNATCDDFGKTPLMYAAEGGKSEVVEFLLQLAESKSKNTGHDDNKDRPNVFQTDNRGRTCLHWVALGSSSDNRIRDADCSRIPQSIIGILGVKKATELWKRGPLKRITTTVDTGLTGVNTETKTEEIPWTSIHEIQELDKLSHGDGWKSKTHEKLIRMKAYLNSEGAKRDEMIRDLELKAGYKLENDALEWEKEKLKPVIVPDVEKKTSNVVTSTSAMMVNTGLISGAPSSSAPSSSTAITTSAVQRPATGQLQSLQQQEKLASMQTSLKSNNNVIGTVTSDSTPSFAQVGGLSKASPSMTTSTGAGQNASSSVKSPVNQGSASVAATRTSQTSATSGATMEGSAGNGEPSSSTGGATGGTNFMYYGSQTAAASKTPGVSTTQSNSLSSSQTTQDTLKSLLGNAYSGANATATSATAGGTTATGASASTPGKAPSGIVAGLTGKATAVNSAITSAMTSTSVTAAATSAKATTSTTPGTRPSAASASQPMEVATKISGVGKASTSQRPTSVTGTAGGASTTPAAGTSAPESAVAKPTSAVSATSATAGTTGTSASATTGTPGGLTTPKPQATSASATSTATSAAVKTTADTAATATTKETSKPAGDMNNMSATSFAERMMLKMKEDQTKASTTGKTPEQLKKEAEIAEVKRRMAEEEALLEKGLTVKEVDAKSKADAQKAAALKGAADKKAEEERKLKEEMEKKRKETADKQKEIDEMKTLMKTTTIQRTTTATNNQQPTTTQQKRADADSSSGEGDIVIGGDFRNKKK